VNYTLKKFSKPSNNSFIEFLDFSTNFVSDSARLALVRVREQDVDALCWFLSESQL
jgi:hypothetical protein